MKRKQLDPYTLEVCARSLRQDAENYESLETRCALRTSASHFEESAKALTKTPKAARKRNG